MLKEEEISSASFAQHCYDNFTAALSHVEPIFKYLKIANLTICLQFAGKVLTQMLLPALEHLEIDSTEKIDFTVCLWDSASTHNIPLNLPAKPNGYTTRGEIIGVHDSKIYAVIDKHNGSLNVFDQNNKLAFYWINNAKDLPWWIGGSPLQLIFHWYLQQYDLQLTHAGAIGYARGGVLLTGKGGSGKSTTTLTCIKAGMNYVSEDYCIISKAPNPHAYCIYNSAKLESNTLNFFPEMKSHIVNTDRKENDKAFIFQHKCYPDKILSHLPLKAVLVLNIKGGSESSLEEIHYQEAIPSLVVTTMWQLVHTGKKTLEHLRDIAAELPCYRLNLGTDLAQIPLLIERLL